jgi:hypothetical protein
MKIGRLSTLQSAKYLQKKKKQRILTITIYSIASLILILTILFSFKLPFLRITNISVIDTLNIKSEDIKKDVLDMISGNYFLFIPKDSFFFLSKEKIYNKIVNDFKKIDTLAIKNKGTTGLEIEITERQPEVMICDGFREDEEGEHCSFADKQGVIFEKVATSSDKIYFKYYSSNEINQDKFLQLQNFVKNVENSGIIATGLLLSEDGSYELYIKNVDQSIAVVYFDDRSSLDKIVSNLSVFWKNSLNKKIGSDLIPNFEYINLRFGNNVFYHIKNNKE